MAKREKQKPELLRGLLTYFHCATKETRPEVFREEIERTNRAAEETQNRWRYRQMMEEPTDVSLRFGDGRVELGRHRGERVRRHIRLSQANLIESTGLSISKESS